MAQQADSPDSERSAERRARIEALFEEALLRPATGIATWLAGESSGDPSLAAEVQRLLAAHSRADGVLDRPIPARLLEPLDGEPAPGDTVGPYRIEEEIGRGGMGVVFRAQDQRLERQVALKFLSPTLARDERARTRFLREARAASALDHPSICTIYDVGETASGQPYIAMAFYEGETLAARLERGALPPHEAVVFTREIARGLDHAHAAGVTHRDIKPSNLLITLQGGIKLLDFGVARVSDGHALTTEGLKIGTIAYMAPEQIRGEATDARADLWALGVVLHEMLAGTRPFGGEQVAAALHAILHADPQPLSTLPGMTPQIADTLTALLEKDPDRRTPSARALLDRLEAPQGGTSGPWRATSGHAIPESATRLPAELTSFVGRESESRAIRELLQTVRLVSLTGPGGAGKTRLALRVASDLAERHQAVVYVPLASLNDAKAVLPVIAIQVGVVDSPALPPFDALVEALRSQEMLVVLDNFEQVVEAAPELSRLLEACPLLRLLVTSRIALRVTGEHEIALGPLEVPPNDVVAVERLGENAALRLFVDRARAVRPGFALTAANASIVRDICRHLDGLPLAIELAAARMKIFSPATLLVKLEQRLDVLADGPRDRPARHRTLRDTFAWSHTLLGAAHQVVFRRLAVFAGGATLDQIRDVVDALDHPAMDLLDGLSSLVDQSLVRRDLDDEGERFSMLETIRDFAAERLDEAGETRRARDAHADAFLAVARRAAPMLTGGGLKSRLDALEREQANFRTALSWLEASGDRTRALGLVVALWRVWVARGQAEQGRRQVERALAVPGTAPANLEAEALAALGVLRHNLSEYAAATSALEQSVGLYRELGDTRGTATVLANLGWIASETGALDRAVRLSEEALALHEAAGDARGTAVALNNLGWVRGFRGEARAALEAFERSLRLREQIDDERGASFARTNLAWAQRLAGDYDSARALLDRALSDVRALGDDTLTAWALHQWGELAFDVDDENLALEALNEAHALWSQVKHPAGVGHTCFILAAVYRELGQGELARQNLEAAEAGWRVTGSIWGLSLIGHLRGVLAADAGDARAAARWLLAALESRLGLRDLRGQAESFFTLAGLLAADHPDLATRLGGLALQVRGRAAVALPVPVQRGWARVESELGERLGAERFAMRLEEGVRLDPAAVPSIVRDLELQTPGS